MMMDYSMAAHPAYYHPAAAGHQSAMQAMGTMGPMSSPVAHHHQGHHQIAGIQSLDLSMRHAMGAPPGASHGKYASSSVTADHQVATCTARQTMASVAAAQSLDLSMRYAMPPPGNDTLIAL